MPSSIEASILQRSQGCSVYLTEVQAPDIRLLHTWFYQANPDLMTCRPWQQQSLEEWQQRFEQSANSPEAFTFAVRRVEDNRLVGRVRYFDFNSRNRAAEIGYLIGQPFRQQGYAKEALQLMLAYLFEGLNANKVMAQTGEFNTASIALLSSLGFQQEGCLRQHHWINGGFYDDLLFSLLASEFTRHRLN